MKSIAIDSSGSEFGSPRKTGVSRCVVCKKRSYVYQQGKCKDCLARSFNGSRILISEFEKILYRKES